MTSFLEAAYTIYEWHIEPTSDRFLFEVIALWRSFGLDIAPITTDELKQREIIPIKRQLSTIISEKQGLC